MPDQIIERGPRLVTSADDVEDSGLRTLYLHWLSVAEVGWPRPETTDAIEFADQAGSWIWLDVLDGGKDFKARFVGTEFDNLVGAATTGLKFSELEPVIGPEPLARLREIASMVLSAGSAVVGGPRRTMLAGKEFVMQRSLSLPFSTNGEAVDRILIAGRLDWTGN